MVYASTLCLEKKVTSGAAAAKASKKFVIKNFTGDLVRKHISRHGNALPKEVGLPLKIDLEAEKQLVDIILLMRAAKLPTWKSIMKKIAKGLIADTKYECLFPDGEVGDSWWKRFVKRHSDKLVTGFQRKHELQRERWTTCLLYTSPSPRD